MGYSHSTEFFLRLPNSYLLKSTALQTDQVHGGGYRVGILNREKGEEKKKKKERERKKERKKKN